MLIERLRALTSRHACVTAHAMSHEKRLTIIDSERYAPSWPDADRNGRRRVPARHDGRRPCDHQEVGAAWRYPPGAVLVDAMNYGRSTRPPTPPAASRATCIAASRAGRG